MPGFLFFTANLAVVNQVDALLSSILLVSEVNSFNVLSCSS